MNVTVPLVALYALVAREQNTNLALQNSITVIIAIIIIVITGDLVCEIRIGMLQGMKMGPVSFLGASAL